MRILLTLRFLGTGYHGWQVQANARTVQAVLQDAVEDATGVRSGVTGCSRTDAGVHAEMFCCALDTAWAHGTKRLMAALNARLPEDVAVYGCREVAADFHPRYDAAGKRYRYRVWNAPARSPFWEGRALHVARPLDAERLREAAAGYVGTHEWSAFCAAGSDVVDRVRTVRRFDVEREGDMVSFVVEADGFLYNMVRIMAGTLLDMQAGRIPWDALPGIIRQGERDRAGKTAAACGLWLENIYYH